MKYLLTAGLSATLIFGAAAENYVLKKSDDWHPVRFDVTAIEKDSILDFGKALQHHRPAGKYGFIKVAGDHFEFEKLPGKKQRFFGVNICGTANIPSKRDAEIMAEAIARAGYNSVRFHHFDNYVCRKDEGPSTELDPEKIDRMDYLVKQLKERGIYITLDLFCSRYVSKNELPSIWHPVHGWNYKNAVYVSAEAQKNFLEFCRNFMLHRNPYTGLSYAEDPAFLFLNILNENFLGIWRADNAGGLGWIWEDLFTKWCRKKGIPKEKRGGKSLRLNAFLYEFILQFHEKMVRELRKMGIRQPLTQFNAGTEPILMAIRSKLDVVDNHFYLDHPRFDKDWNLPSNHRQTSFLEDDQWQFAHLILPFGKPHAETEMRFCKPNQARGEGGAIRGAVASLQDSDAFYTFQWTWGGNQYNQETFGGWFDLNGDPISYLSDHIMHLLFLRGDVAPSKETALQILPEDLTSLDTERQRSRGSISKTLSMVLRIGTTTRDKAESHAFTFDYGSRPSLDRMLRRLSSGPVGEKGVYDPGNGRFVSTTGELEFNQKTKQFKVVTPRSEALVFINTGTNAGKVLEVENRTPYTTFFAAAMDGQNLSDSARILFFHLNNAGHTNMTFRDNSMKKMIQYGNIPHLVHQATGKISLLLNKAGRTPKVYAVNLKGQRLGEIPSSFREGKLNFTAETKGLNGQAVLVYEIER